MITENDFNLAFEPNSWKRVGAKHPVDLYYGKDNKGRNSIEFSGVFTINKKIRSSIVIEITHYKNSNGIKSIVFSLLDNNLLRQFSDFLNSMIDATSKCIKSNQDAYKVVCDVYFIMQKMFRSNSEILSEAEIKGLIGELLFLRDRLIPEFGETKAISSWSGAEKTRKDFAIDNNWYEIKTINFGKDTVHISSIEQLDSPNEGSLLIYQVEKMAEEYNGLKLNELVRSILIKIQSINDKDIFVNKLQDYRYFYNPQYDEFVYEVRNLDEYIVDSEFPRIKRDLIHKAICKASFDLTISNLAQFKK